MILHRTVSSRGGRMRIGGCHPDVRGVLVRCTLDSAVPLFESVDEALTAPVR